MFSIIEIRPFLAYMSVFHLIYICFIILCSGYYNTGYLFTYLILYVFLNILIFSILLVVSFDIKFLTDLELFEQFIILGGFIICAFASMAGIPPFNGF